MSAGSAVSKEWSPRIAAAGAVVIDNSCWRCRRRGAVDRAEVNADVVAGFRKKGIANPIRADRAARGRPQAAARQGDHQARGGGDLSVGVGAGKEAMDELFAQSKSVFTTRASRVKKFPKRIAFNLIPHIDAFMEDGFTKEEWKMVAETKKILDPKIRLVATCVRVPVFIGHSEAVAIEFENPITAEEARAAAQCAGLPGDRQARGRRLCHPLRGGGRGRHLHQPHPRGPHGREERPDAVVRVRQLLGAALNAIQIAECPINRKLIQAKRKAA